MRTLLVFATLCFSTAYADEWTKRFPLTGQPDLRVDAEDAAVILRSGAGNAIEARLTTHGWNIGPGGIRVTERQAGNRVEIEIRMPHGQWGFFTSRSARLELTVPRQLRANIHTGDGSVNAQTLKGELRLVTGDGSIEADEVEGSLEARTGDGGIRVRGRFDRLDLHTGDGSVTASVASGSKMAGPWRIHSGDGSVTVRLPGDLAADLDVHTGDGSVTVNVPLLTNTIRGERDVRGKLNGGGSTLRIETGDGSIRVDRL